MKWAEISIQTSHEATEAVANIFHDLGSTGVVIEDPELINAYRHSGIWDYCDIPEDQHPEVVTVKAYLPVDESLDEKLRSFEQRVNELQRHNLDKGRGFIRWREIQDQDWESAWKQYFHPEHIGDRLVIKPSWEDYQALPTDVVIELDPGMAFGTGTHHTTVMCIKSLEREVKPGNVVFDVGTGSGVLAIFAAKLGAAQVQAIDLDPVAVRVANENVALNHVNDVVTVQQGDLLTGVTGQADVIVANIVADVIMRILKDVPNRLTASGLFIASGIINERLGEVTAAFLQSELIIDQVIEEGGWAAIVAHKGGQ